MAHLSVNTQTEQSLESIIQRLFGRQAQLTEDLESVPEEARFFAVTNSSGHYRWVIPQASKWGLSVLQQWQPYGLLSKSQWQGWLALYRTGLHNLPKTKAFGVLNASPLWSAIKTGAAQYNSNELVPVTYVGTLCQVQKLVVTLVNKADSQPVAVAKVPLGEHAWPRIQQEAELLEALKETGLAPELITIDEQNQFALQRFEPGKLLGGQLDKSLVQWLLSLPKTGKQISLVQYVHHLQQQVKIATNVSALNKTHLLTFLEKLSASLKTDQLPSVIQHGDFVPWNLKKTPEGQLMALDWEAGHQEGLPLFDLIHFQLMLNYSQQKPPEDLFDMLDLPEVRHYMAQYNLDEQTACSLIYTYCVNLWCHHVNNHDFDYAEQYYHYIEPVLTQFK